MNRRDNIRYKWADYDESYAETVESWLDEEARRYTSCDDGWREFYEYWKNDSEMTLGENFWCKVISDGAIPFGVIALSLFDNSFTVMEYVIAPSHRRKGYGCSALRELLENSPAIIGRSVTRVEAVIFPDNTASQKAFVKAGFTFDHAHPDGDAWYYVYTFPHT